MTKIYTITLQHTYTVEAKNKQEALENVEITEYDEEKLIEIEWVGKLEKPTVV